MIEGILGLLILIGDVWAIVNTLQSGASNGEKTAWIVAIIVLPAIGFIAWLFFGPRGAGVR